MSNDTPKIAEGSVNFWIKPNQVQFSDSNMVPLVQLSPDNGSILIVKDDDNYIKFFHVLIGKGRTDVEYDASHLDVSQPHMITATWSITSGEITLYVDGELAAKSQIKYAKKS